MSPTIPQSQYFNFEKRGNRRVRTKIYIWNTEACKQEFISQNLLKNPTAFKEFG